MPTELFKMEFLIRIGQDFFPHRSLEPLQRIQIFSVSADAADADEY